MSGRGLGAWAWEQTRRSPCCSTARPRAASQGQSPRRRGLGARVDGIGEHGLGSKHAALLAAPQPVLGRLRKASRPGDGAEEHECLLLDSPSSGGFLRPVAPETGLGSTSACCSTARPRAASQGQSPQRRGWGARVPAARQPVLGRLRKASRPEDGAGEHEGTGLGSMGLGANTLLSLLLHSPSSGGFARPVAPETGLRSTKGRDLGAWAWEQHCSLITDHSSSRPALSWQWHTARQPHPPVS
jgi:hypothetical protein